MLGRVLAAQAGCAGVAGEDGRGDGGRGLAGAVVLQQDVDAASAGGHPHGGLALLVSRPHVDPVLGREDTPVSPEPDPLTLHTPPQAPTHPDEQLGHHHVAQLAGGVQCSAGGRSHAPGPTPVDLLLGAVGQQKQQPGEVPVRHRAQQPGRHAALGGRAYGQGRHELPLLILGPDPRLPLLPGGESSEPVRNH